MKNTVLAAILLTFSSITTAGSCGVGKITTILIGGWNNDDYKIKIDYSGGESSHSGTELSGYIVYKESSLSDSRLNAIKSLTLAAKTTGQSVNTYSHNDDCSDATQISIW